MYLITQRFNAYSGTLIFATLSYQVLWIMDQGTQTNGRDLSCQCLCCICNNQVDAFVEARCEHLVCEQCSDAWQKIQHSGRDCPLCSTKLSKDIICVAISKEKVSPTHHLVDFKSSDNNALMLAVDVITFAIRTSIHFTIDWLDKYLIWEGWRSSL